MESDQKTKIKDPPFYTKKGRLPTIPAVSA